MSLLIQSIRNTYAFVLHLLHKIIVLLNVSFFQIDGYEEIKKIPIVRAGNMMFNLTPIKKKGAPETIFSVVLEIKANMDTREIIIRSPLQVSGQSYHSVGGV